MMRRTAESIIKRHYGLSRRLTQAEVDAEIANVKRRAEAMTLDDSYERLHAALALAGHLEPTATTSSEGR